jgi:hypothetical protein
VAAIGLEVACRFPLQIKFIDVFCVFCLDQLSNELELLAKAKDCLLEDRHFPWSPFFKDEDGGDWIDEDIQVSFFVEVVDCIEIELNWLLLLLWIGLVYFVLRLDNLKNGMLLQSEVLQELHVVVVLTLLTGLQNFRVNLFKIRFSFD